MVIFLAVVSVQAKVISGASKDAILRQHNMARKAANVPPIVWDNLLAKVSKLAKMNMLHHLYIVFPFQFSNQYVTACPAGCNLKHSGMTHDLVDLRISRVLANICSQICQLGIFLVVFFNIATSFKRCRQRLARKKVQINGRHRSAWREPCGRLRKTLGYTVGNSALD